MSYQFQQYLVFSTTKLMHMRKFSSSLAAICLMALSFVFQNASAQQKELTYEQIFKAGSSNIFQPLPMVQGWADDDHYLIMQKDKSDNDKLKLMSVDAKTGNAMTADWSWGLRRRR